MFNNIKNSWTIPLKLSLNYISFKQFNSISIRKEL